MQPGYAFFNERRTCYQRHCIYSPHVLASNASMSRRPDYRHNANQGLWLCAIAFFTLLFSGKYYTGFGLLSGAVDIFNVHLLFEHSFATSLFVNPPLVWLPIAIPSIFVTICSVTSFIRCLQYGSWQIPIFGRSILQ